MDDGDSASAIFSVFHFGDCGHEEQHLSVTGGRKSPAEPPCKAAPGFGFHLGFFILPLTAKGRIGEDVIEPLLLKLIVRERVGPNLRLGGHPGKSVQLHEIVFSSQGRGLRMHQRFHRLWNTDGIIRPCRDHPQFLVQRRKLALLDRGDVLVEAHRSHAPT